ncbi:MAG: gliding motility-associated C-terminal domain-containing protein [Flavobacteriales bacterium]|nr:gliding motility-associated C-terminal domain-containing protein [Flavobacteriales bacterium]
MHVINVLFAAILAQVVSARQPVPAQQPQKPAEPCALSVPTSIALNIEEVPRVVCDCRITAFSGKVYSRWGQELFATDDAALFPSGLLRTEQLQPGTYMWVIEYTVVVGADAVDRKSTGYINVL